MIPHDHYFSLSEGKVLVNGARNSVVLDFKDGRMYCVNATGKRLIERGEQGVKIEDVIKALTDIKSADIHTFLEDSVDQGLIQLSEEPKRQHLEERPLPNLDFLWVEVTSCCNLRCVHCYAEAVGKAGKDLSDEALKKMIDEAAALGCRKIQFTGGEPVLRDNLQELVEHAKTKGFTSIEIFTNGTLLTEPLIQFFSKERISVAVSIYSYKPETHDSITGMPGSFERTLTNLKLLLAYEVSTRCALVALKQNENDLKRTSHFLSQIGVLTGPPDPVRPSGRGKKLKNWPEKYRLFSMQTRPTFSVSRTSCEKNRHWNSCWFGKAAVTSRGDVLPCVFARDQIAGNIKQKNLSEIIKGEKMLHFWGLTKDHIEVCKDCEYRYVCEDCRPWAYGITGNLYAKSPRCTYNPYTGEWADPCDSQK